jgi:hypothetical protein
MTSCPLKASAGKVAKCEDNCELLIDFAGKPTCAIVALAINTGRIAEELQKR